MDPVGTLMSIATLALALDELSDSYAEAPRTLLSIKTQVKVLEASLQRIQEWLHYTDPTSKAQIRGSLADATATVDSSIQSLKEDLDLICNTGPKTLKVLGRQRSDQWSKSKFAWNEGKLRKHLTDMRECSSLMHFTLTVCQLPTGRASEIEIEELGVGARTLSRAHKSTRKDRRSMLSDTKTQAVREQSKDFNAFMDSVKTAEEDLPDDASPEDPLSREQSSQNWQEDSAIATRPGAALEGGSNLPRLQDEKVANNAAASPKTRPSVTPPMLVTELEERHGETQSRSMSLPSPLPDTSFSSPVTIPRKPLRSPVSTPSQTYPWVDSSAGSSSVTTLTIATAPSSRNDRSLSEETADLPSRMSTLSTNSTSPLARSPDHEEEKQSSRDRPPPYAQHTLTRSYASPPFSPGPRRPSQSIFSSQRRLSTRISSETLTAMYNASDCPALTRAVQDNDENTLNALLNEATDLEIREAITQRTPLLEAAYMGHRGICRSLIAAGSNVHAHDVDGNTSLHLAATSGDALICRMLCDAEAPLEALNLDACTPLQVAAAASKSEAVIVLLDSKPKYKTNEPYLLDAFYEAVRSGDVRTARNFLTKYIKMKKIKDAWKPVCCAAECGNLAMLDLVLKEKCELKERDPDAWTALHFAAYHGHTAMCSRLIELGLSAKLQTKSQSQTALHLAVSAGYDATALLLATTPDSPPTRANAEGEEPLHLALRRNSPLPLISAILGTKASASLKSRTAYGWTAVHLATAYGHTALLAAILTHNVDLESRLATPSLNPAKATPEAARKGHWCEIRWPHEGARPLHLAIEFGHPEIVDLLLAAGAKVDEPDARKWRPIHYAAFACQPSILETLLDKGASPHSTTTDGFIALELGFRQYGLTNADLEGDKRRVDEMLQVAMATKKKSAFKDFKFGTSRGDSKTAKDRNVVWHRAEMADELYREGSGDSGIGSTLSPSLSRMSIVGDDGLQVRRSG